MPLSFTFEYKKIWQSYNVRGAVLMSLYLQVLLVLIGPSRKRTKKGTVNLLIWGAYLLADWVASFAIGLISTGEGKKYLLDDDLAAFWAPFLLVHLGGQDTVTAFSLEDNQLWVRRLLELIVHLVLVAYVFIQTTPNRFWISTVLMFCAGTIKYAERTRALYLACLTNFKAHVLPKPDPGPDYAQLMEDYSSNKSADIPVRIVIKGELERDPIKGELERDPSSRLQYKGIDIDDISIVTNGYKFYKVFRGLMVELMFSFDFRDESRSFFFQRNFHDAFRVMEVELNFMYDVFYTKMNVVHRKIGYLFRFFCDILIVVAFTLFATLHEHELRRIDITVSYTLFGGAIFLDFVSLVRAILSDWTVAWLDSRKNQTALNVLFWIRKRLPFKGSRWSNSMSQHNLIGYCLEEQVICFDKIAKFFGLKEVLDEFLYKVTIEVEDELKKFIFMELMEKATEAENAKTAKEISKSKGYWVLSQSKLFDPNNLPRRKNENGEIKCNETLLFDSVSETVEFDETLLLWHIATELCYSEDFDNSLNDNTRINLNNSKRLSNYMLYLLVMRRGMMSAVAGMGQIRFADTIEEAKKFFRSKEEISKKQTMNEACKNLREVATVVKPIDIKGDRSQSLLFDGCMLAKSLKNLEKIEDRWEIMGKVWVEILAYAATHIRADAHGQQLSKGGELLTFVWLLMAHFGLGDQFRIQAGTARAKLVVGR